MEKKILLIVIGVIVVIVLAVIALVFPTMFTSVEKTYDLKGKKVLIVIFEDFQPLEFNPVHNLLIKSKAEVKVLAINKTVGVKYDYYIVNLVGKFGQIAKTYDAIVIIGGGGVYSRVMGEIKDPGLDMLIELCKEFHKRGKLVAAICAAPGVLAKAGILKGLKATCFPNGELIKLLKEHGANYVNKRVVRDKNVITSVGPETAKDFAIAVCEYLSGK